MRRAKLRNGKVFATFVQNSIGGMEQNKRTQIAELGEFGLIDKLTGAFAPRNRTTLRGVGDDAAVIAASRSEATLVSTDLLMEGIDFDLTYFPLKHLGYKTVTVGAQIGADGVPARQLGAQRQGALRVAVLQRTPAVGAVSLVTAPQGLQAVWAKRFRHGVASFSA